MNNASPSSVAGARGARQPARRRHASKKASVIAFTVAALAAAFGLGPSWPSR
jgi:hypothetical protein